MEKTRVAGRATAPITVASATEPKRLKQNKSKNSKMKTYYHPLSAALFAATLLAQFAGESSTLAQNGVWTEKAPLPAAECYSVAAPIGGVIYVAGGNNGAALSTFYAYSPLLNTWSTLPSLPGARYAMSGAGVISNKLYVAGGWTYSPPLPNNNLWVYDPEANTWDTSRAPMPLLSGDGASGVISNKFYVTTPDNGYSGVYNYLHVYDPAQDKWTPLASSPIAHKGPGYGVVGAALYVVGGYNGSGVITTQLDVYDPVANAWTTKSPMTTPRYACASAVVNGKLYVVGGWDGTKYLSSMEVYDPSSATWTTEAPMITRRNGVSGASVNGVLYAIGGANATQPLPNTEAFSTLTVSVVSANDPLMKQPNQLASDGVSLFVSGYGPEYPNQYIFQVPTAGGAASILYSAFNPWQVALVGTSVFWIDPNAGPITDTEVLQAPKKGSGPVTPIYIGSRVGQPIVDGTGLTSDGFELYAVDEVGGTVWRLNPDGSGLTELGGSRYGGGFSTEHVNTIAVYQGVLYIADSRTPDMV